MHPRRTRRDTKEEERLESLLRDAGALEYEGTMARPSWAKVRERLEIAPRRRSIVAPALAFGAAALLVVGYGLWVMGYGAKQPVTEKRQPIVANRQPIIDDQQPQPSSPTPNRQNPKPETKKPNPKPPARRFLAQKRQPSTPQTSFGHNHQPLTIDHHSSTIVVARTYAPGGYEITTTWEGNVQTTVTTCTQPRQPAFFVVKTAYPSPQPPAQRDEGITIQSASILPTVIRSSDALTRQTVISAQPLEAAEEKTEVRPLLQQKLSLNLSADAETEVTEGGVEE